MALELNLITNNDNINELLCTSWLSHITFIDLSKNWKNDRKYDTKVSILKVSIIYRVLIPVCRGTQVPNVRFFISSLGWDGEEQRGNISNIFVCFDQRGNIPPKLMNI